MHELFARPQHPYTIGLLGAIPRPGAADERAVLREIPGRVPSLAELPRRVRVRAALPARRRPQPLASCPSCARSGRSTSSRASTRAGTTAREHGALPTLEVVELVKHFRVGRASAAAASCTRSTASRSRSRRARCSGSSASRAAASRRSRTASSGCSSRRRARSGCKGDDITHLSRRALRPLRQRMHIVFQDPYSSLNPRMTCGADRRRAAAPAPSRARQALDRKRRSTSSTASGCARSCGFRYPHELSGGQRQRVGLARALSVSPERARRRRAGVGARRLRAGVDPQPAARPAAGLGFSCLFITHDLATVEFLCDRVAVMYLGKIVELAPTAELFASPQHPYTQALLSAAVVPDPSCSARGHASSSQATSRARSTPPSGCRFRTRCPLAHESRPRLDRGGAAADRYRRRPPRRLSPRRVRMTAPELIDTAELRA